MSRLTALPGTDCDGGLCSIWLFTDFYVLQNMCFRRLRTLLRAYIGSVYRSFELSRSPLHPAPSVPSVWNELPVGGVAQWSRRRSLAGGLSLIYA